MDPLPLTVQGPPWLASPPWLPPRGWLPHRRQPPGGRPGGAPEHTDIQWSADTGRTMNMHAVVFQPRHLKLMAPKLRRPPPPGWRPSPLAEPTHQDRLPRAFQTRHSGGPSRYLPRLGEKWLHLRPVWVLLDSQGYLGHRRATLINIAGDLRAAEVFQGLPRKRALKRMKKHYADSGWKFRLAWKGARRFTPKGSIASAGVPPSPPSSPPSPPSLAPTERPSIISVSDEAVVAPPASSGSAPAESLGCTPPRGPGPPPLGVLVDQAAPPAPGSAGSTW